MTVRTKGNAKWLFKEDVKDKFLRRIPSGGAFGNRDIIVNGKRIKGFHIGTDYGANIGEKLIAYDDFEVKKVGGHSDYGKQVFLYFPKINKTGHYAHMNKVSVKVGDKGKAGQVIGESGNTGRSQGPHLHFSFGNGIITDTGKSRAWENFENYKYSPINKGLKEHKEDGEITVTVNVGLRVRQEPSLNAKQTGLLPKGTKKVYTHFVDNDGIRWVKLKEGGYAARRTLDKKTIYASARFLSESPKPAPKPQPKPTKVGKYANLSGAMWLFKEARKDDTYPSGKNRLTQLKNRSAKILAEDNGRVKISVPSFNPNVVWVANRQITVSDKPKFPIR